MSNNTCAVVTPVGPGHEAAYKQCAESVERAFQAASGGFSNLMALRMDDPDGVYGSARARNMAIGAALSHGADWLLFLDADDLLSVDAFRDAKPYFDDYDAIWGQVFTFQDGSSEAIKREPQTDQTESLVELLKQHPDTALQSGHFVRASVAEQFLFDETAESGSELDQFLQLWENSKAIKISHPISLKRMNDTPRPRAVAETRILTRYRLKHGITAGSAPQPADYRMDLAIFGMIGCGTRELAHLLSVPNERIILDEPALLGQEWARHLQLQLSEFGISISDYDWSRKNYLTFQEFFDVQILPRISRLSCWGISTTRFDGWQQRLQTYPADKLVLCVRDIRDVVHSHVDIAQKLGVPIDGQFIEHRTLMSAAAILEMRSVPHIEIRYEEAAAEGGLGYLAEQLGVEIEGAPADAVTPAGPPNRFRTEQRPELIEFVNRIWRQSEDYSRAFGYELPSGSYGHVA